MYLYNHDLSVTLAEKYPDKISERACYDNVYHLTTDFIEELQPASELRILFCYRQGPDGFYYRHVFCMFKGELVEPLTYLDMSDSNLKRIIPIRELSFSEYLDLMVKDEETSLRNSLYDDDLRVVKEARIYNILCAYDLAQLYREIDLDWPPDDMNP